MPYHATGTHVPLCLYGHICDSQKLKTTQMSQNRRMDIENMVYLHNGILFSYLKQRHHKFCREMDGTKKYHLE